MPHKPHQYVQFHKKLPWRLCVLCGLLTLRNDRSERAMKQACPGKE